MESTDIKPCPFCGSEVLDVAEEEGFYAVICGTCEARGGIRDEKFLAVHAWNLRFDSSTNTELEDFLY